MKMNKKNIEHIFKEKIQEFEAVPSEHLWTNISEEINPKKDRKKVILLWYFGGGIAASLLLFSALFFNSSYNKNTNPIVINDTEDYCPEKNIVNESKEIELNEKIENNNFSKNHLNTKNMVVHKPAKNYSKIIESSSYNKKAQPNIVVKKNMNPNSFASAEVKQTPIPNSRPKENSPLDENPSENLSNLTENNNILDNELRALLQINKEEETPKKEENKRWSIQPQVTTFSYNSNGSTINTDFKNNPQNTQTDIGYGMRIAYQATPKITLRTGVNNALINITTSNIGVKNSGNTPTSVLFTNNDVAVVNLNSDSVTNDFSTPEVVQEPIILDSSDSLDGGESGQENEDGEGGEEGGENPITSGKISQQIQYIEIPLEVTYKLLDKKIGLDLIGGFSTFIISNNESSFKSTNSNTQLGETTSFNNTSFSSNIGFSINYRLINNIKLNIEPMVKFQFNSFDNSTDNQPYFIGVSSGLSWNF